MRRPLQAPQRLYVPPSSRGGNSHDNYEDTDLDNIDYDDNDGSKDPGSDDNNHGNAGGGDEEVDALDAFMEGINAEVWSAPPPKPKAKAEKYKDDDEEDHMESFLRAKRTWCSRWHRMLYTPDMTPMRRYMRPPRPSMSGCWSTIQMIIPLFTRGRSSRFQLSIIVQSTTSRLIRIFTRRKSRFQG